MWKNRLPLIYNKKLKILCFGKKNDNLVKIFIYFWVTLLANMGRILGRDQTMLSFSLTWVKLEPFLCMWDTQIPDKMIVQTYFQISIVNMRKCHEYWLFILQFQNCLFSLFLKLFYFIFHVIFMYRYPRFCKQGFLLFVTECTDIKNHLEPFFSLGSILFVCLWSIERLDQS